jgi:LysM repeat protein
MAPPELSAAPAKESPIMTGPLTPVSSAESPVAGSPDPGRAPVGMAPATPLSSAWAQVDGYLRKGEIANALKLLSSYYSAELSDADRAELLRWLDALAFKVIYSTEHQLSPIPHIVQSGETLDSIARSWNVPKQLLININRSKIPATDELTPGLELKIVRGPFRAEIDRARRELTLFLGEYYAGRFPIDASSCQSLSTGSLSVQNVTQDANGSMALTLSNGILLCGAGSGAGPNAILLNPADAQDLFCILSADSQVAVIR